MKTYLYTVLFLGLAAQTYAANAAGDAVYGASLYKLQCTICHSADYNGIGPLHKGVFGRMAGQVAGFAYSPALKGSKLVWDEATLDRWLTNPEKLVPGQIMGFSVGNASDRADLIAFLKKLGTPG